ncbi:Uncharacterised protein [Vibrio cholerae]|nr:Uncharacterised protein [Vibrio cholerae]
MKHTILSIFTDNDMSHIISIAISFYVLPYWYSLFTNFQKFIYLGQDRI